MLLVFVATTSYAASFEGPLTIKNGHPLYALLDSPSLASAKPENSFDLNFSYSSTYLVDGNQNWHFGIDLETACFDIQLKRLIGDSLEFGFDLPLIRYGSGFMDNYLEEYHRDIGMPGAYGRNKRPSNVFLFDVTQNGRAVVRAVPNRAGVGDVMLEIKKVLYQKDGTIASVQGFLNVPTGDSRYGFGSGNMNGGIAMLLDKPLRNDVMLYINAGLGLLNRLSALQDVELKNYYYGGAGLEWMYSTRVLFNVQMIIQSSPYPKTGVRGVDDPSMMATFGSRYKIDDANSLGIALTEDPDTAGAPDIMAGVEYRYRF